MRTPAEPGADGRVGALWAFTLGLLRLVAKVWTEPAFDFGQFHPFAAGVVLNLVASQAVDREIPCGRMREVEARNASGRVHGEALGKLDAGCTLGIQKLEEGAFFS